MLKKHPWKIIGGIALLLLAASFYWASTAGEKANEGVEIVSHVKGSDDAKVVLTEYSDFQCPACGQFQPVINDMLEEFGDSVRFEYKHFPLISIHPFAVPAAKAAEAAGQQGKFFEMHDKLFENQSVWSAGASPQIYFLKYAEEIGLDIDLFKQHMRASMIDEHIESQFNEAREKGLTGTPSFFLNGQRMQFETFEDFIDQIDVAVNGVSSSSAEVSPEAGSEGGIKFGI